MDPRELHGVIDLTTVNDRSFLAVVQQRPDNNFNLLSPTSGQSELRFGRDFTGDLTPRFGCVTGISGEGRGVPTFWTVDEDRERVFRVRMNGGLPTALEVEFEEISDIEAAVTGEVVVVDYDEERVVVLTVEGSVATTFDDLDEPWDVGLDDYGRVYVYDGATRRVVQLGP